MTWDTPMRKVLIISSKWKLTKDPSRLHGTEGTSAMPTTGTMVSYLATCQVPSSGQFAGMGRHQACLDVSHREFLSYRKYKSSKPSSQVLRGQKARKIFEGPTCSLVSVSCPFLFPEHKWGADELLKLPPYRLNINKTSLPASFPIKAGPKVAI